MIKRLLAISVFVIVSCTVFGQTNPEYSKTLQKMFDVSGSKENYQAAIDQMFSMFQQQYPEVPAELWGELKTEFNQLSLNELTEMLVPVYEKHLTIEDLKELIKFYESPTGKKFAKTTPLIMQETMQIGQQWGIKIGEEFAKKMSERGY